jgi:hypothetical protein
MWKQKQLFRHEPHNGINGDCWRTSLACLLEIPQYKVPHFLQVEMETGYRAAQHIYDWLFDRDLHIVDIPIYDIEQWFKFNAVQNPNTYYLLGGTSPRGWGHSVVALGGKVVWDPSKASDGDFANSLTGPMSDGFYWASFIVPARVTVAYDG